VKLKPNLVLINVSLQTTLAQSRVLKELGSPRIFIEKHEANNSNKS
jgi:hypothetical protein